MPTSSFQLEGQYTSSGLEKSQKESPASAFKNHVQGSKNAMIDPNFFCLGSTLDP